MRKRLSGNLKKNLLRAIYGLNDLIKKHNVLEESGTCC